MFSTFALDKQPEVELLDLTAALVLIFQGASTLFRSGRANIPPATGHEGPVSTSSLTLSRVFLMTATVTHVGWKLMVV